MKTFSSTTEGFALCDGAEELLRAHVAGSVAAKQRMAAECGAEILAAAGALAAAFRRGGKALLCGNGGSAADSQHMAAELVSSLRRECTRPGLPAIALTTDSSILTASANDFGYDGIFERQVETLGRDGDVLVAISTSGNSENVLRAVRAAGARGIDTVALTSAPGGKLAAEARVAVRVPSGNTQHVQEAHITVMHIFCDLLERTLFPEQFS